MSIQLHTHRLVRIALTFAIGLATFVAPLAGPVAAAAPAKADTPDALEIYNRDVFVIVGSTLRLPDDTTAADAPLFNVAGVPLNLTWGDWQQASATSRASVTGGKKNPKTDFRIHLTGLAPNGVYSIFYVTLSPDSENPLCAGVERSLPVLTVKQRKNMPDASSVVADANGEARFHGQVPGDLLGAGQVYIFIVYHLDGAVYGSLPNHGEFNTQGGTCRSSFGEDAMRQLLITQKG